jgi:hypothetical protein
MSSPCPECGALVLSVDAVCQSCGAPSSAERAGSTRPVAQRTSEPVGCVAVLLSLLGAAVVIVFGELVLLLVANGIPFSH